MKQTFQIRNAKPADFEQWLLLWKGYNAFYGREGKTELSREITETTWRRFFDVQERMHALVAEIDGKLVGLAHYLFHRSTTMIPDTCYLQDIFTASEVRGRGIGKAFIQRVYERAKEAGSTRVYWQTHETNATAMKLYDQVAERSGFLVYRKQLE